MPRMTWPGLTGSRTAAVARISRGRTDNAAQQKSMSSLIAPEVFKRDLTLPKVYRKSNFMSQEGPWPVQMNRSPSTMRTSSR